MGMGTGWVYRGGYTGYYPATLLEESPRYSEAGPEGLQGLEWWYLGLGRTGGWGRLPGPPSGPGR